MNVTRTERDTQGMSVGQAAKAGREPAWRGNGHVRALRAFVLGVASWLGAAAGLEACDGSGPEAALASRDQLVAPANRRGGDDARLPASDYTLFEADPVRPIAVLSQQRRLAIANGVDDFLELVSVA